MRRKTIFGIVISLVTMVALGTASVFAAAPCEVGTFTNLPQHTIITNAALVTPPATVGGVNITTAFCRVQVTNIRPYDVTPGDADIYSEVWLPLDWNGRYLGLGNGGSAPNFQWAALNTAIIGGYATANTTMGIHENMPNEPLGGALEFSSGIGHFQRVINFGYLATHLMTISAKDIIKTFYGSSPAHSYFTGCSTGGGQAMFEAQRYPKDYDGIVVGAGTFNRVASHEKLVWMYQTNQFHAPPKDFTRDPEHYIPPGTLPADWGKWALITNAVTAACDGLDGVMDGIIDDPRECKFDAHTLLCPAGTDSPTCLTPGEVWTINQLWRGAFNPRTGKRIILGMTKGSESDPSLYKGATGIYFYPLAFQGPQPPEPLSPSWGLGCAKLLNWAPGLENFDLRYFDWDRDAAIVDHQLGPILNATDPDLSRFKASGGKLIMYHGWADPLVYSLESPIYYERVLETMGDLNKVKHFARLFMVPGMGHCGYGGPFPAAFNALPDLVNWVEKGEAPDQIIATHPFTGMTRPVCAYPEVARYKGSGSTNDAANFLCVPPVEVRIEPEIIHLKSKGELTAFITVPEGFDVRDWGISNLECQGAPMIKGFVSHDGRTYIAKFSIQDLTNTAAGKEVTLKVEGLFKKGSDQALLLGFDEVRVIK